MLPLSCYCIKEDLKNFYCLINKEMQIKAGRVDELVDLEAHMSYLHPTIIILISKLLGGSPKKVSSFAGIVQFIFLATNIHAKTYDRYETENSNFDSKSQIQYPVLIGDFLYGKFFQYICQAELTCYLEPLASVIGKIQLSQVMLNSMIQTKGNKEIFEIVRLRDAELAAVSCQLTAIISQASKMQEQLLYQFGFDLGMAYGLMKFNYTREAALYLSSALNKIKTFSASETSENLIDFVIFYFEKEFNYFYQDNVSMDVKYNAEG